MAIACDGDNKITLTTIVNETNLKTDKTSDVGSTKISTGTTGERDGAPAAGYFRFNSTDTSFEGYNGTNWGSVGGGATGGGIDDVFYENAQIMTVDYTLTANKHAMSAGPISIDTGITLTVPDGAVWTIV